jgi:hypothetical protein
MNHVIHNVSVIILTAGIIMMIVYITKASSNNFLTTEQMIMSKDRTPNNIEESIYDYRVSKEYKKMFIEPSVLFGYASFDENENPDKLYVKEKK